LAGQVEDEIAMFLGDKNVKTLQYFASYSRQE